MFLSRKDIFEYKVPSKYIREFARLVYLKEEREVLEIIVGPRWCRRGV
jgi:hypothetical protein